MGFFDNIIGSLTGKPADDAAEKNRQLLQQNQTAGTDTLNQGQTNAIGALNQAGGLYGGLASKYGGATSLALDALGVNGPAGNDRATAAFRASPGYQYALDQSNQNVLRNAAVTGGVAGGNTLAALSDRAGNLADQNYQTWLSNLQNYVSPELQATGGQASAYGAQAPVYQNTAQNIANLGTNTTNGIANQNTQQANADMAAGKNAIGLGMSIASLAAGGLGGMGGMGGLTGLLGGGGGASTGATYAPSGPGGYGMMGGVPFQMA